MRKIFVIGNLGSGKSTVSTYLAEKGLPVIDFDVLGHEVLKLPSVKAALKEAFGEDIEEACGEKPHCGIEETETNSRINRALLAQRAFADAASTARLNAITWPAIFARFDELVSAYEEQGVSAVVVEQSAFQSREHSQVGVRDVVLMVRAPFELRLFRACERGFSQADARARMERQGDDARLAACADVIFENTGNKEDLRRKVSTWWETWSKQAKER